MQEHGLAFAILRSECCILSDAPKSGCRKQSPHIAALQDHAGSSASTSNLRYARRVHVQFSVFQIVMRWLLVVGTCGDCSKAAD